MANEQFNQFPVNNAPSNGAIVYIVDANNSYQANISTYTGSQIQPNTYYLTTNPNQFCTSGNLTSTGSVIYSELTGMSGYLLSLIGMNKNGLYSINGISGNITLQGAGNVTITTNGHNIIISGNTGIFYSTSNPNNFTSSGNVENTGTAIQNQIRGVSGQLNITGGNLFNSIRILSGYITGIKTFEYLQPNQQIVDFTQVTAGSCINTPLIGNNIIPANSINAGDIFYGEFSYGIVQIAHVTLNLNLTLQIQNNFYSGFFGGTNGNILQFYYKIFAASRNQLYLTPITIPFAIGNTLSYPFADLSSTNVYPLYATGMTIDGTQNCKIDLISSIDFTTAASGIMNYSFLKKL